MIKLVPTVSFNCTVLNCISWSCVHPSLPFASSSSLALISWFAVNLEAIWARRTVLLSCCSVNIGASSSFLYVSRVGGPHTGTERTEEGGVETEGGSAWLFNTLNCPLRVSHQVRWKNRPRPEEPPLPQCIRTSLAPPPWGQAPPPWGQAPPPWGQAAPGPPTPKRKRDYSSKGRYY